ncbi:AraC family transcriptional regulator [Paenibacillus koleovorans]|uniref:AraC family transcriptional regulator n=1 Tax=Paenibacillus koleovorans TaxID=121608 RepID=UPI0013E3E03C|nr:AraC family transcriptional regulator [Paenibacillus koleovorans]
MTEVYPHYEDAILTRNLSHKKFSFYIGLHTHGNYPIHHHEQIELSVVLEGSGVTFINGSSYLLKPGTMLIIQPHHLHNFSTAGDGRFVQLCCMLDIRILAEGLMEPDLRGILSKLGDELSPVLELDSDSFQLIRRHLFEALDEFNGPGLGGNCMIRSKLVEVFIAFIRQHSQLRELWHPPQVEQKIDDWKLLQYVNTHYMEEQVTIDYVAALFKCSATYISRLYKAQVGQSFLSHLHELRIRRALSLLAATEMKISDIAADTGFESLRTFSRVFRNLKGMTPSEYRHSLAELKNRGQ